MKYIDSEKLIARIKGIIAVVKVKKHPDTFGSIEQCMAAAEIEALDIALDCIKELQQEQSDQTKDVWIHKKYNREYRIVSDNARLKNSNGEWIDCVIYAPLYENEFEMFAREKESFYKEFEKK